MSKRLHYLVRSVVALFCISFLLFSEHLDVKAETRNYWDVLEASPIVDNNTQVNLSVGVSIQPTNSYSDMGGGTITYSESGTSTSRGSGHIVGLSGTRGTSSISQYSLGSASISISGSISSADYNNATTGTATISATTTHGGSTILHYKIPLLIELPLISGKSIDNNKYYGWCPVISATPTFNNTSGVTLSNFCLLSEKGEIIRKQGSATRSCVYMLGSEILGSSNYTVLIGNFVEFDLLCSNVTDYDTGTVDIEIFSRLYKVRDTYQDSVGTVQSDPIQHQLQQENNATASDTNTTTHSIFDSISAFFGSFFSNLIGVFVPEDGFFTTWFNNLNSLLEAKLGILYYPFSVIIQFFTRCTTAFSSQSTGTDIVFPAIEFTNSATGETYTFLSAQHINLADFNIATSSSANSSLVGSSGFGSLVDIIRTFNAFVILFCLLSLLRTKLNLVLRGDNNDN